MDTARRLGPVRVWLYAVAALVLVTVVVGGATRLTGSGLSITEWRPVTGIVPPLDSADWETEFAKYREIPQYQRVNRGMSLDEFKSIYWWEWTHRVLGRLVGLTFVLPFLWFLVSGRVGRDLAPRLLALLALGGAQGAIGWFMVRSGLTERVSVSQYRLALHLTVASVIFSVTLWTARALVPSTHHREPPARLRLTAQAILGLVFLQIFLGALVAGLHAGLGYQTWPLMDGRLVPPLENLLAMQPSWANFFENTLTVQFQHRMTAYVLLVVAVLHALDASEAEAGARLRAWALLALVFGQATLGVLTLLDAVPIGLALAHQAGAVAVLGLATVHAQALAPRRSAPVTTGVPSAVPG